VSREPAQPEPVETPRAQPAGSFRDTLAMGGAGPGMIEFHADSFEMGSGSMSQNFDERPRHTVQLARFAMSKHEITFDDYDRFASATGRRRPSDEGWGRGKRPVINVSWDDAVAYTRWLSEQTGHPYRLPTEAEWEFVARSGAISRYWWGNDPGQGNANCFDCGGEWAGRSTAPVGRFGASGFGMHDMAGNVREWVQDCYQGSYAGAPADGTAVELGGCSERVARGGSFSSSSQALRSASRERYNAESRLDDLGFRVVRDF
jgi:formylglycine-generating enzyme required for sulfatase activity